MMGRNPFPLVGMIGKKRSGKDSFAATLVEERGFVRFAFADPLKEAALRVDPFVLCDEIGPHRLSQVVRRMGWEKAKEIREVRRLLQEYGVAVREIDEDFWLRATMNRVDGTAAPVVVTDCRFPNEADEIRRRGGTIIRIVRPGLESDDQHESETALDNYLEDVTICNGGTLEDLATQARSLLL